MASSEEEIVDFVQKMDWEGGLDGLVGYGGPDLDGVPEEIREEYQTAARAIEAFEEKFRELGWEEFHS
jgi:adenylate cyclase class IV